MLACRACVRVSPYVAPRRPQIAKLLDAKDQGDTYLVEYTIEKPPEPQRYLLSLVSLAPNNRWVPSHE